VGEVAMAVERVRLRARARAKARTGVKRCISIFRGE
jgi:hypothetical protein